jgi:hypothetical protein
VYRSAAGGLEGTKVNNPGALEASLYRVRRKTVQGHVMTGSATKTDQAIADNSH